VVQIPVIDCDPRSRDEGAIASDMDRALKEVGFMALANSGVEDAAVASMFVTAGEFFSQSELDKQRSAYGSAEENFGYQRVGQEKLDPSKPPDLKETFTMRNLLRSPIAQERWPHASFRAAAEGFYDQAMSAALRLQRLLALSLKVPQNYFPSRHSGENVTLRLLHYPPVERAGVVSSQMGAGAHTDYGMLTLLWQDDVGGLQVCDEDGHWHDVPPQPGTVIINSGDLLERWSNGRYRSTWHRVLPRYSAQGHSHDRYSIALFVDPDSDTVIDALPNCTGASNPPRYPRTTAGAHVQAKIEASHLVDVHLGK
jgi:isopenicillin N synthase-like dioxygenase